MSRFFVRLGVIVVALACCLSALGQPVGVGHSSKVRVQDSNPFALQARLSGSTLSLAWTPANTPFYVTVSGYNVGTVYSAWVYGWSLNVTLQAADTYQITVAKPSENPAIASVTYTDYVDQRTVEPYFPLSDTPLQTVCFSWDRQPDDYAYFLQVYTASGDKYYQGWIYDSVQKVDLIPGAYRWRVTPYGGNVNGTGIASPWVSFNVLNFPSQGVTNLLGSNPYLPSSPNRAGLAYPESVLSIGPNRWLIADAYHHVLKLVTPDNCSVYAGQSISGYNGDHHRLGVQLTRPSAMTTDAASNVLFFDSGNLLLRRLKFSDETITTVAGVQGISGSHDSDGNVVGSPIGFITTMNTLGGKVFVGMTFTDADRSRSFLYELNGSTFTLITASRAMDAVTIHGIDQLGTDLYVSYEDIQAQFHIDKIAQDGSVTPVLATPSTISEIAVIGPNQLYFGSHTSLKFFDGNQESETLHTFANVARVSRQPDGTLLIGDSDAGAAYSYNPITGSLATVARNYSNSFGTPVDIVQEDLNHVLLLNNNPGGVYRFNIQTGETRKVAGNGRVDFSGQGLSALQSSLRYPTAITKDAIGNIYVSEQNGVVRIDKTTGFISHFIGTPQVSGYLNGPSNTALFASLHGLKFDEFGDMYIADAFNRRVRKWDHLTGLVSTVAGDGTSGTYTPIYNVPATLVGVNTPWDMMPFRGGVYLLESWRNNISFVDPNGLLFPAAGVSLQSNYQGHGAFLDGARLDAKFNTPTHISFYGKGADFLVTDSFNNCVREVNSYVTTLLGDGRSGLSDTTLNNPQSAIVINGVIYIADTGNGLLRSYRPPVAVKP